MVCRPPHSLTNALHQADEIAPGRHSDPESDGICADPRHIAGGTSNHIPDARGVPHAVDVDDDPDEGYDAHYWAEQVRLRIKAGDEVGQVVTEIISDHRFTSARHDWDWVDYGGSDPHESHAHYSIARTSFAENWDGSWWAAEEDLSIMDAATKKYLETEFGNITKRDAAMQEKFADEVEAVDQKSRRILVDIIEAVVEVAELDKAKVRARLGTEAQKIWDKVD